MEFECQIQKVFVQGLCIQRVNGRKDENNFERKIKMENLRKFLVTLFGLCLSIFLSIIVMIKGWGLEPQSYWWIIGVGIAGQLGAQLLIAAGISSE